MIDGKEIMDKIGGRKQQTLQTALLVFIIGKLMLFGNMLSERGQWMKGINKHRQIMVEHRASVLEYIIKNDLRMDNIEQDVDEILKNQAKEQYNEKLD